MTQHRQKDHEMSTDRYDTKAQLEGFVSRWEAELPAEMAPVVHEHYQNLVQLAKVLKSTGRSQDQIRRDVHVLICSYEAKILEAIRLEDMR